MSKNIYQVTEDTPVWMHQYQQNYGNITVCHCDSMCHFYTSWNWMIGGYSKGERQQLYMKHYTRGHSTDD